MGTFYAVNKGHKTGVFETWAECQKATTGYPNARFKKFQNREEAEAFAGGVISNTSLQKDGGFQSTDNGNFRVIVPFDFPVKIYTDGACEPNPGASGSGVAVYENGNITKLKYGYHNPKGTNNYAELIALREAFKIALRYVNNNIPVEILSDSVYALKAIFVWSNNWARNGWINSAKEPVKNAELIKECAELATAVKGKVQITHVAAHNGTEGNEVADRLSVQASIDQVTSWEEYTDHRSVPDILNLTRG